MVGVGGAIAIYILVGMACTYCLWPECAYRPEQKLPMRQAKMEKEQETACQHYEYALFANVSHEFRTPLTMIAESVVQLASSPDISGHDRSLLAIVKTNVHRMLQLVNQLLDFNKPR